MIQRSGSSNKVKGMKRASSFSDGDGDTEEEEVRKHEEPDKKEKPKEPVTAKKVLVRSVTASLLCLLYLGLLQTGHLYCIICLMLVQTELYREIVNVRYVAAKERSMPLFRSLQWMWFLIAMIFVYGDTLHRFCTEHRSLHYLVNMTKHLDYAVYGMYWILFMVSVLTLKPGLIRFQLSQHMWSIATVCLVVFQSTFYATNTLNGLFWFFFPFATVIMNDVSAYFVGITCGRKFISAPFLALSPNKTWEGFIGAGIATLVFSFFFPALLAQFTWFTCPANELYIYPFPPPLHCEVNPIFLPTNYTIPYLDYTVTLYPMQFHGLAYGLFASIVAPFGGFFASAIKRAYNKKDFDSFMPGHGGMMDRMDCQLLMTTFTAFYYNTFLASKSVSVERMIYLASAMTAENQYILWQELGKQLGKL